MDPPGRLTGEFEAEVIAVNEPITGRPPVGEPPATLTETQGRVVRLVRDAGTISRSDLARRTGLGRALLKQVLQALADAGLVKEVGAGVSTGGRPPALVRFEERAGYVVGVVLGDGHVDVAITDLLANPVAHVSAVIDAGAGPEQVLDVIYQSIDGFIEDGPVKPSDIRGVGIGMPGSAMRSSIGPVLPPIPRWSSPSRGGNRLPIREGLHQRYGWPIFADSDVNLMATGEATGGVGAANFLYVKLGGGISCGIICDGRLHRGRNGSAGDIGHMAVSGSSTACLCGNIGCLEAIAGGRALTRAATDLARRGANSELATPAGDGDITMAGLVAALRNGDPASIDLIRVAGSAIGEVLAALVNFFNPALIILGGGLTDVGDVLVAAVRESVYRRALPLATRDLSVVIGALGGRAGVVGAASLVLDQLYRLRPANLA